MFIIQDTVILLIALPVLVLHNYVILGEAQLQDSLS